MKSLITITSIFIMACSKGHEKIYSVDPAFQSYVNLFYSEAAKRGINVQHDDLIVQFESGNEIEASDESGECSKGTNNTPTITISDFRWNYELADNGDESQAAANFRELNKRQLIFHELGHCLLNRKHNNFLTESTDPISGGHYKKSIMHSKVGIDTDFYSQHYDEYLDELFGFGQGPN